MLREVLTLENANLNTIIHHLSRMAKEGADPETPKGNLVQQLAQEATAFSANPLSAIFDFIQKTFPYGPDSKYTGNEEDEYFVHPGRMAEEYFKGVAMQVDCDDHAMLTYSMGKHIGQKMQLRLLDTNMDGWVDHASAYVHHDVLGWISMDTSTKWMPLGWTIPSGRTIVIN